MMWMTRKSIVMAIALTLSTSMIAALPERAYSAQNVAAASSSAKSTAIESITMDGAGYAAELVIKLTAPAVYTSYKNTTPLRLVLDLSQASPGSIAAPIVFNKGNFKTVTANRYDTDAGVLTRINIELDKDAEAVVAAPPGKPGELRISFPALVAAATETPVQQPASVESPKVAVIPAEVPAEPKLTAVAADQAAIRSLTNITATDNMIALEIKGGAGEFKSFRLNNPERFVVDLLGVRSVMADRLIPVNAAGVASARLGLYPDKLRVVFDAVNGTFPETTVAKNAAGLILTLGDKHADSSTPEDRPVTGLKAKATPAAPQTQPLVPVVPVAVDKPAAKAASAKPAARVHGQASVEMIDFQVIEGISRVSVRVSGDVEIEPLTKEAGFVSLTVKNASLPKYLQRSLEAKGFISPVLRVTPLLVKTRKGFDTKIRIAMRVAAAPELRQEGDMLYVDFKNPDGLTADKITADLQEERALAPRTGKAPVAKEATIGSELTEPVAKPIDTAKSYKGRKVTLEFADAEVRKIFQLLSEVSNKNFVLGDDVAGTISIKLVNVPWDQALDIILDTKGLDKREDGNIIIIKGKGKFKSQAEEEQEIKKALTKAIELKTETFSVNYADISAISAQFEKLKVSDRASISTDTRTNKVIVKDIPQALDDMRKLLQQLDVPEKQVMIEARIVEATSTFTRNLGVNWGVHFRDGSASFMGINALDTGFGGLTSAPPTSGTGTSSGGTMGISFGTLTSNIQLDMRLNAAASAGLIKIVSTPKVATLNNKTAKITQGQQIPYTSSTSDKVETKFIEAALSLEVTPHINANGTIGMKIDAKNDSPGSSTGGSAPPINKKQATTEMLLKDGETTVIGGIYVDSDNESDDGVPFLMDIPFLGKLFKTNNKTKTKTELLIFITPRILGTI